MAPGTLLADRFEVDGAPLGEGATGVVYPAIDRETGRPVAAKLLHAHLAHDATALARLRAEAGAAGRLHHAGVVDVIGLWADGDRRVLVTERVSGCAVDDLDGPLAPEAVVALGLQLADALAHAHVAGLVHGDVRPGNVLVGPRGALLFDFGVARWVASSDDASSLRPGETAPEVLDGAPPGPPADLYGLGIVLYRALTGRRAFTGETPWAAIGRQRAGEVALPDAPRGLVALIRRLLDPDPTARPRSAVAVRSALRRLTTDPGRRLRLPSRWLPPVRPGRTWIVHGTDPATGGPAVVRAGLSRAAALELVERLERSGWSVAAEREALGLRDVLVVATLTLAVGVVLPFVGLPIGLWAGLRWRTSRIRPRLRDALATVRTPVPPRPAPPGAETAITVGLLLLATAAALTWWPVLALVPGLLCVLLVVHSWRTRLPDEAALASEGRVAATLDQLRADLERRRLPLDRTLGLLGEVESLEHGWRQGDLGADALLSRAERLRVEVEDAASDADGPLPALEALRRASEP